MIRLILQDLYHCLLKAEIYVKTLFLILLLSAVYMYINNVETEEPTDDVYQMLKLLEDKEVTK